MASNQSNQKSSLIKDTSLRNIGTYAILGIALAALTFVGVCDPVGNTAGPGGPAATVGPYKISQLDFQRMYLHFERMFSGQEGFDPVEFGLARQTLETLINQRVNYHLARENGIGTALVELEQEVLQDENLRGENGSFSSERFKQFLRQNAFSEATYFQFLEQQRTVEKFQDFILMSTYRSREAARLNYQATETKLEVEYLQIDPATIKVDVTQAQIDEFLEAGGTDEVKAYYDSRSNEYNQPEQRRARHILISYNGARNATGEAAQRSKEDARTMAERLAAEAKTSNFAKLAAEHSDDQVSKANGGDLDWFTRADMVQEFADAAFALRQGQVSGVVESPFGFHIIKAEGVREARSTSLEEATPEIAKRLVNEKRQPAIAAERAEALTNSIKEPSQLEALASQFNLRWQSTDEFTAETRFIPGIGSAASIKSAIMTLKEPGEIYPEVVRSDSTYYVLRLKSRQDAELESLTDDQLREMQRNQSFQAAQTLLRAYTSAVQRELEENNKIHRNPQVLDQQQRRG